MHIAQYTAHTRKEDITEYTQSGNGRFLVCSAVYAPAERADTLTVFHLYPYMYSVVEER